MVWGKIASYLVLGFWYFFSSRPVVFKQIKCNSSLLQAVIKDYETIS